MSDFHGANTYVIVSANGTDARICLETAKKDDGTKIHIWKGSSTGLWVIAYVGHGPSGKEEYVILNKIAGTYLSSAASLTQGHCTGNLLSPRDNRVRWNIVPVRNGSGAYWISPVHDKEQGLCCASGKIDNGTVVKVAPIGRSDKSWQFYLRIADDAVLNCPDVPKAA